MATPEKKSSSIIPQISKKLAYRTLFLVVVFGGVGGGLMWFMKVRSDLSRLRKSDTVGWIAAVEYLPQGQQAVLISPDGQIHKDPGYVPNATDRDVVWSPGGNFVYFASDRVDHNFNIFRWSPGAADASEQRTIGTRARSSLKFPAQTTEEADSEAKGHITTGGFVQEFDPVSTSTQQILPPSTKEIAQSKGGDESGTQSQFEGAYGSLGTSFREAHWCNNHQAIAGIMRRDNGEILIIQSMKVVDGKFPTPQPLVAGDHIDVAINPKSGSVVYCVDGFQWPDPATAAAAAANAAASGKKLKKPFINAVGSFDFVGKNSILGANDGQLTFTSPAISPDGTGIAIVIGKNTNGDMTPVGVATLPSTDDKTYKRNSFPGDVHEPTWSPDGKRLLVAVRVPNKNRTIFEIPLDGSPARNITGDTGNFGFPKYSPQTKAN